MIKIENQGITLIELLIGISILSIVGGMTISILGLSARLHRSVLGESSSQIEGQALSRRLETAIMNAQSLYMEETEEGMVFFTGKRRRNVDSMSYSGELFWFNKDSGCVYQNRNTYVECPLMENEGNLNFEIVKKAVEEDTASGKTYLVSRGIKELSCSLYDDEKKTKPISNLENQDKNNKKPIVHYEITIQAPSGEVSHVTTSVISRNRVERLRWKAGKNGEE